MKMSFTTFLKQSRPVAVAAAFCFISGCGGKNSSWQGYIDADMLYISPESGGIITELFVRRGDTVKKGDKLFELDRTEYLAAYSEAEANLKKAAAQLQDILKGARQEEIDEIKAKISSLKAVYELSNIEHERNRLLHGKDAVSQKDYDTAKWNLERDLRAMNEAEQSLKVAMLPARKDQIEAAQEAVKAAENSFAAAKWRLDQRTVFAQHNARVFDVLLRQGEYATPGNAAVSLIAPENVKVRFFVKYADAFKLKTGDKIEFTTEKPENRYSAVVNYISPKPEYTPPVIYSQENTDKLMFMIEAMPGLEDAAVLNPGLPVIVKAAQTGN